MTYTEECEQVALIIADGPPEGVSLDEIEETGQKGQNLTPLTRGRINTILTDFVLKGQVSSGKVRVKHASVIKYRLKNRS